MRYLALGIVLAFATAAAADDTPPSKVATATATPPPEESASVRVPEPPPAPLPPGITLPAGTVQLAITVETNVSRHAVGSPVSIAPDISYGITNNLMIAIVHSSSQLTGFRGSAGYGVCLGDSCSSVYADGGVELLGNLVRGTFALAAEAGLLATNTEPWRTDLKLGFRAKVGKRVFATISPSVWVALDARNDPTAPHKDQLWVPVGVGVKPVAALTTGIGSGFKGPLDALGRSWSMPLGAYAQVAVTPKVALGSSFVWGKLEGGDPKTPGIASRAVQVWLSVLDGPVH